MKPVFNISGPEMVGLAILGATVGAVVCGGASNSGMSGMALYGAAVGGVGVPAISRLNWGRLGILTLKTGKVAQP